MRSIAAALLTVTMAATLGAQVGAPAARVLSERRGTFVSVEAFIADVAGADLVFVNERATAPDLHRFEAAFLESLGGRRDVILALDAIDRAAQDPLEHFQMEHLSDEEFLAQAKMPAGVGQTTLPLMKLAVARRWPIVATGGAATDGAAAVAAPLIQALGLGSTGGKRPLLVSVHTGTDRGVMAAIAGLVLRQSPGLRAVTVQLVAVPSFEVLAPPATPPSGPGYVVYTLANR